MRGFRILAHNDESTKILKSENKQIEEKIELAQENNKNKINPFMFIYLYPLKVPISPFSEIFIY